MHRPRKTRVCDGRGKEERILKKSKLVRRIAGLKMKENPLGLEEFEIEESTSVLQQIHPLSAP